MGDRINMRSGAVAQALARHFEGYRTLAYPDPATGGKPWTIGIGHTGTDVYPGLVWTDEQIEAAYRADTAFADAAVNEGLEGAACLQFRFDAMVSLAFNIGRSNFLNSTLLRLHLAGDWAGAGAQFRRWDKAGSPLRSMLGLRRRRYAESLAYAGVPVEEAIERASRVE